MDKDEFTNLWKGRYVENYPHEFWSLLQEIQQINPLKTIIEIGVKCCGTMRVWEKLVPSDAGMVIGVDIEAKEKLLACSGRCPDPPWEWEACPSSLIHPSDCVEDLFNPEQSDRQLHFVIGNSLSVEVHEKIAYLLGERKADLVFHDGHHWGDVALRFLRSGGLFVLSDFRTDGVDALRARLATLGPVQVIQPDRAGFALWRKPA